jgi:dUTP pyrophosphatase
MRIRIRRLRPDAALPEYAHGPAEDAGLDLRAVEGVTLEPGAPQLVPTGLSIELPPGYEAQIRPRSGLALKHAITLREPYEIQPGDRIAQMVIARYEPIEWEEGELNESRRGEGGFGSSGR